MTATIPTPEQLWHNRYDEVLYDSPDGALDSIVRSLLIQVDDITIEEVDRITERSVVAGKAAILSTVARESGRFAVDS